ncbi:MAG: AI-2E family transporter [Bdellovibrionales bacterium]|nr:AI-2E family transporter [Bdellovibrionales bacterium]
MLTARQRDSLFPPLWVLFALFLCGIGWLAYELKEIVFLLIVGYCVAYILDPVLDHLEQKNISRSVGVFLILLVLTLAVVLLALTAIPTIVREFGELSKNFPTYFETVKEKLHPLMGVLSPYLPTDFSLEHGLSYLTEHAPAVSGDTIQGIVSGIASTLLRGYSLTLTIVNLFLLPFLVYYIAVDFDRINSYVLEWFPILQRQKVAKLFAEIDMYVSAYVRGQLTVGFVLFLLYATGLGIIGVELWFLIAVVSGFGNLIPYLGSIVGILLSTVMTLVTFGTFTHVLIVWGLYAVVQFLEGTFITPWIVGDKVGLSPLSVLLALLAGGTLFGLIGIFLAVPGVAIARVLIRVFHGWLLTRSQGGY